jgi:invasion protein IalB
MIAIKPQLRTMTAVRAGKLINQQVSMMKSNSRVAKMALPLAYTAINRNERQLKLSQSVGSRHPVAKTFNVIRNTASLLAAAGIMTALATAGMAQQKVPSVSPKQFGPRVNAPKTGAPNRPAPELIAENGKWKVQCETRPAGKDAKGKDIAARKACAMVQISRDAKRPQIALSLIMRQQKQGNKTATMMQIMAPIGVFLPTGIALEIDGAAVGRVPFVRCLPQTRSAPGLCTATAEAQAATVAKMKAGNSANFIIYEAPGAAIKMPISLDGFTASYKALLDNS